MLDYDKENFTFRYSYLGKSYLYITFDNPGEVYYKRGSDHDIQTMPPIQQLVFSAEKSCKATMTFYLNDAIVLKPNRATKNQAILSQHGKPLIYGVNGLYDLVDDTYITWHGIKWNYLSKSIQRVEDSDVVNISVDINVGDTLVINVLQCYYQLHLGYTNHRPLERRFDNRTICGWCSWEAYLRNIKQDDVCETVEFLKGKLRDYGLEYIQIDDGYQSTLMPPENASLYDGWTLTNEKFPDGHEGIIKTIQDAGFKPGIWTNSAISNRDYAALSSSFFKDSSGEPLKVAWLGYVMTCDDEILNEVHAIFKMLREMGYEYFKIDAIRHLIYDGLQTAVREGYISSEEAHSRFRAYIKTIRDAIGDDSYLLSCWGVLTESVGLADALRFATDAGASNASLYMMLYESARWHHTHGILYKNDPDHLCLRAGYDFTKTVTSVTSLNGYVYMISDNVSEYNDDLVDIVKVTIPPIDAVTAETGPVDLTVASNYYKNFKAPFDSNAFSPGSLWVTHFSQTDRHWAVVNAILLGEESDDKTSITINLENLGLNPDKTYIGFDFWSQRPLGKIDKQLTINNQKETQNSVIALNELTGELQLIASSRHVSMDVISVTDVIKSEKGLTMRLKGIKGDTVDYWFAIPDDVSSNAIAVDNSTGAGVTITNIDGFAKLSYTFNSETADLHVYIM